MLHSLPDLLRQGQAGNAANNVIYAGDERKRVNERHEPGLGQVRHSAQPALLAHGDLDTALHAADAQSERALRPTPIPIPRGNLDQDLVPRPDPLSHQVTFIELKDQRVRHSLRMNLTPIDSLLHNAPPLTIDP
jgi:hypothetical protein